jgi:hypothetical protein
MRPIGYLLVAALSLIAAIAATYAATPVEHIYQVEAANCVSLPEPRVQTGFRLSGMNGIVTALHGVVGCSHRTARRPDTGEVHLNLEIALVDFERDIAVLRGPSLHGSGGITPHPTSIPDQLTVHVIGHPSAMPGTWRMPLQVESFAFVPLSQALPPNLYQAVQARRSPAVWVPVLRLNGDLQPGHSGAPVVDAEGRVLGIGSGGLGDGTLGIGWAIPLREIDWQPASERAQDLKLLAGQEPNLVFAYKDPQAPIIEPIIRSRGSGCIAQTFLFDLDRGHSAPNQADGDLFLQAQTREERYLQPNPWSNAEMTVIGNRDFERVTLPALQRATYSRHGVNASRDARNQLPYGTVLGVRTSEGQLAKLRINQSRGDFVDFEWITFALPSEGPSPVSPVVEPCGAEQALLCGEGKLAGDRIDNFTVESIAGSEMVIAVRHGHNPAHGHVWLGARLLDNNGAALSSGFYPTAAAPTRETRMRVDVGSGRSRYLLVWMYESYKSEAFVCRRLRIGNPTAYVAVSLRCKTPVKALLHVEQGEMVCLEDNPGGGKCLETVF